MFPKDGANALAHDIEAAAFIAEDIAPAASARRLPLRVFSECNGPRARNHDNTRITGSCARKSDAGIVCHYDPLCIKQFAQQRGLIIRPAAHTQTGRPESQSGRLHSGALCRL